MKEERPRMLLRVDFHPSKDPASFRPASIQVPALEKDIRLSAGYFSADRMSDEVPFVSFRSRHLIRFPHPAA